MEALITVSLAHKGLGFRLRGWGLWWFVKMMACVKGFGV